MLADHQGKWRLTDLTRRVTNQHLRLAVCEMGPDWRQRRKSFPPVEFNVKKTRLTCNNKSRCEGQNTFLKNAIVIFVAC